MTFVSLPLDKTLRFRALDAILKSLPGDPAGNTPILDVGGFPGDFAAFHGGRGRVITVDLPPCRRPDYVQATATALPFADLTFPVVVSSDALEHVPPGDRDRFVAECMRCAARFVIIGCPAASPAVLECEEALREVHGLLSATPHPWLDEHHRFGLPDVAGVTAMLKQAGAADVAVIRAGALRPWLYLNAWGIIGEAVPAVLPLERAAARIVEFLEQQDVLAAGPLCYRVFFLGAKNEPLPPAVVSRITSRQRWSDEQCEAELAVLREMALDFRECAEALKAHLAPGGGRSAEAAGDEAYIRRLEDLLNAVAERKAGGKERLPERLLKRLGLKR
ncbi:MAG: hypothetical protein Kow0059_08000 [Candidatus Sumerlaeia bacterium]